MIISQRYKYLFVELPQTGTTAISRELRQNYEGKSILHKHATYDLFLQTATPEEKKYFVFSSIRNPLDNTVSYYFKIRNDHNGSVSRLRRSKLFTRLFYSDRIRRQIYIEQTDADFGAYFLKFYHRPYDNWSTISHAKSDFVIRFETIAEDFLQVLALIGIEPKRPLPVVNKTAERGESFLSYYDRPAVRARAMRVFGPYMEKWGYAFPAEWGSYQTTPAAKLELGFYNSFRKVFWKYLRPQVYTRIFNELEVKHVSERLQQATQKGASQR